MTGALDKALTDEENAARAQRFAEACHLQEIEGNPLTAEEIEMFQMFEREGWSPEKRRAYIMNLFKPAIAAQ
jgi:hypothetical protein